MGEGVGTGRRGVGGGSKEGVARGDGGWVRGENDEGGGEGAGRSLPGHGNYSWSPSPHQGATRSV